MSETISIWVYDGVPEWVESLWETYRPRPRNRLGIEDEEVTGEDIASPAVAGLIRQWRE